MPTLDLPGQASIALGVSQIGENDLSQLGDTADVAQPAARRLGMVVPLVVDAQLSLGADVRVLGQAAQVTQEIILPVGRAELGVAHVSPKCSSASGMPGSDWE